MLRRLARTARDEWQVRRDPIGYARRIGVTVGDHVWLPGLSRRTFSTEPELIAIGDWTAVAAECRFLTHDGGAWVFRREHPTIEVVGPITIGANCMIGLGTLLLPNTEIGDFSVIGAGSVVTGSIPAGVVAVGVPAKPIMGIDEYRAKSLAKAIFVADRPEAERRRLFVEFVGGRVDQQGDPIAGG